MKFMHSLPQVINSYGVGNISSKKYTNQSLPPHLSDEKPYCIGEREKSCIMFQRLLLELLLLQQEKSNLRRWTQ